MARDEVAFQPNPEAANVLVVDDEEIVCMFLLAALQQQGYKTMSACSGEEGLRLFSAHSSEIDLVISDVVMPDISGYQMVERIRSSRPDVPVLFITGTMQDLSAWATGTCAVLRKPFTVEDFITAVHDCLGAGRQ